MCVRTKTSYGCGHVYKTTTDCYNSACSGVDKYHYLKEWDCRDCRSEGVSSSKGRESKTRLQPKSKRSQEKDRSYLSSQEALSTDNEAIVGTSPWAPFSQEKMWESPHRKQADDAWLSEHEDRMIDLHERFEKIKVADSRSQSNFHRELVLVSEDYDHDGYERDEDNDRSDCETVESLIRKPVRKEVRRHVTERLQRPERSRSHRHQNRQNSRDSLPDSMPSYRSSPMKKSSSYHTVQAQPEASYEYDYYNNPSSYAYPKHHHKHHHQPHNRSRSDQQHYITKSYGHDSDYETITPAPPPLPMPQPMVEAYDTYKYYSPGASPSTAPYVYSDYPYDYNQIQPPRPQHIAYRRY